MIYSYGKEEKQMENIDKIKELLDDIRPFLNLEGGDVEFIKYEDDYVYVKLIGACAMCSFKDLTLQDNIESYLKEEIPSIKGVINVSL